MSHYLKKLNCDAKGAEKINLREIIPREFKDIDSLIDNNLIEPDLGTPELEKYLRMNGHNIQVESHFSPGDGLCLINPYTILIVSALLAVLFRKKYFDD